MKKVLLLMIQPPGGTGVQGLRYSKLFPFTQSMGWELHFAGPDPQLSSVGLEPLVCPREHCHYTRKISLSHRFSILKNRQAKQSSLYLLYGLLQLAARSIEGWLKHDRLGYLEKGLEESIIKADRRYDFDLIAAKSPDFRILEVGAALAHKLGKPLLAIYDDPHGQRDEIEFYPDDPERQMHVLNQAAGVLYMSPLTRDRYVDHGLVEPSKTFCLTDSYPLEAKYYRCELKTPATKTVDGSRTDPQKAKPLTMAHLGNLPEWRPIDPLLTALASLDSMPDSPPFRVDFYGYLYPRAHELIDGINSNLARHQLSIHNAVGHLDSHRVAAASDILLVMIGLRHLDNQPSKFFVYLGHKKPILIIGPLGNPIQKIVEDLGIGVYADVRSNTSIRDGILELTTNYKAYQQAFEKHHQKLKLYGADEVAVNLVAVLDKTLANAKIV